MGLWAAAPTKLVQSWESGPTFTGAEHTADTARRQQKRTPPKTSPEAERAAKRSGPTLSSLPKLPLLRHSSQCCRSIPEFRGLLLSITARLLSGPGRDFSVTHDTHSCLSSPSSKEHLWGTPRTFARNMSPQAACLINTCTIRS